MLFFRGFAQAEEQWIAEMINAQLNNKHSRIFPFGDLIRT